MAWYLDEGVQQGGPRASGSERLWETLLSVGCPVPALLMVSQQALVSHARITFDVLGSPLGNAEFSHQFICHKLSEGQWSPVKARRGWVG